MNLHRYALFTAFATFLLIIAGALVTSTGSGLSVPTWPFAPGTLLPALKGGVLFEYGHRMIAGTVVILAAVLVFWLFKSNASTGIKRLGLAGILAIILQAALGGVTVLFGLPLWVSVAHAGIAQGFFCIVVSLALLTNPACAESTKHVENAATINTLAIITSSAVTIQILIGAVMRHLGAGLAIPDFPLSFGHLVPPAGEFTVPVAVNFAHRVGACVVSFLVIWFSLRVISTPSSLRKYGVINLFLLAAQIGLGALTIWSRRAVPPTTAHVAVGALLLANNVSLAILSRHVLK